MPSSGVQEPRFVAILGSMITPGHNARIARAPCAEIVG